VMIDKRFPKSSIEPFHAGIYLLRWAISALIGTALVISGGITLHLAPWRFRRELDCQLWHLFLPMLIVREKSSAERR